MSHRPSAIAAYAVLLVLGVAACRPPDARPDTQAPALVETLPPEIASVRTAGWWSDGGRSGTFRIVMTRHGFDKLVSRLYLQWLDVDEAGSRVVATRGFERLNAVPVYQLELSSVRSTESGIEAELNGASLYTGGTPTFLLRAGAPGTATLIELE